MKENYIRAMDVLHRACVIAAGACLVVITLIIPYGVFCRYVLNSAASWPEPMAVLLMIVMSFLSAVVCYREYLHIGVGVLPAFLSGPAKTYLGWFLEICMLATNFFMLDMGDQVGRGDTPSEHPGLSGTQRWPVIPANPRWGRNNRIVHHRTIYDAEVLR